jgi:hypothetical protein
VADKWTEIDLGGAKGAEEGKTGSEVEAETPAVEQAAGTENETAATPDTDEADSGLKVRGEAEAPEDDEEAKAAEGIQGRRAEKRIKRLVREKKALKQQFESELAREREEREALANRLKAIEETQTRSAEAQAVQYERTLEEKLSAVGKDWQAAFDAGDKDGMLRAQEAQVDLKLEKRRLEDWKRQRAAAPKQEAKAPAATDRQVTAAEETDEAEGPSIHPKAQQWIARQKWWGKDRILTAATAAIAGQLEEEGLDPGDDDYYGEVEKRLKTEFPNKFAQSAASKPTQVVAGQSRSPAPNKVRLSDEDVRLARQFGLNLEDYARSKQQSESAGSGYVPVQIKTR